MDLVYFFGLGIILTLISLDKNNRFKSKYLRKCSDEEITAGKIISGIVLAWFVAGNAFLFLHLGYGGIEEFYHGSLLGGRIILIIFFINIFVMPFYIFNKLIKKA